MDALDIFTKMFTNFSGIDQLTDVDFGGCQAALWNLIRNHSRQAVQKRSCGAVAGLSIYLSDVSFKTLLDNIKSILSNSSDLMNCKIILYCLAAISKSSGARIGPYLNDWVDLILKLRKVNDDEISEYCLQVWLFLINFSLL